MEEENRKLLIDIADKARKEIEEKKGKKRNKN
jgi:hypothetical protein